MTHPLIYADISIFSTKISNFLYIWKYSYILDLSNIFESSKVFLVKKDEFLTISAKFATLGFPKIKVFWNKRYEDRTSVCDITNKILSCDSNYIVNVVMWPKFGILNISMTEVMDLPGKTNFFEGCCWLKFNNLRLEQGMVLTFYTSLTKGLKQNLKNF